MEYSIFIYVIIAGLFGYAGYRTWKLIEISRRTAAGKTWPSITGEVVSKDNGEVGSTDGTSSYYPKIRYKYSVIGRVYEKEITLHGDYNLPNSEKALSQIGETIEVRYNPEKPEEHITRVEKFSAKDILSISGMVFIAILMLIGVLT